MGLPDHLTKKFTLAEQEYERLMLELSRHSPGRASEEIKRMARSMSELEPSVMAFRSLREMAAEREKLTEALAGEDREFAELARVEIEQIMTRESETEEKLRVMAQARAGRVEDSRGVILEIRAGTGGDEAALFASDLLRMYLRLADARGWKAEVVETHGTELGGAKGTSLSIDGKDVWRWLKHEGGVHRVQRVPVTEASGRLHTSAVAVVVLPQAEEVDVRIAPEDIRVDRFCSSGPGGQSVNTTYSAVRIVHLPSGIVVQCQDERSQIKNKARAMKVLRARLHAAKEDAQAVERGQARREQVRKADRSEKIRTYNFPQNRVTDHRAGVTIYRLQQILDGDLGELLEALDQADTEGRMKV